MMRPIIISFTSGRARLATSLPKTAIAIHSRSLGSFAATSRHIFGSSLTNLNTMKYHRHLVLRSLASSSSSGEKKTTEKTNTNSEGEEGTSSEIVLTPGEKVVVGTRLFFWAGAFAFASVCAYYIGQSNIIFWTIISRSTCSYVVLQWQSNSVRNFFLTTHILYFVYIRKGALAH